MKRTIFCCLFCAFALNSFAQVPKWADFAPYALPANPCPLRGRLAFDTAAGLRVCDLVSGSLVWQTLSTPGGAESLGTYIASTFGSESTGQIEQLYISVSPDGINWSGVTGHSLFPAATSVRDPSILWYGQKFWIVYTSGSFGPSTSFGLASSQDLINWTKIADVSPGIADTEVVWAPEWFTDSNGSVHVIVTVRTPGTIYDLYEIHPTDLVGFTTWSAATALTWDPVTHNHNDNVIAKIGATYNLFYQDTNSPWCIERATASALTGPYTTIGAGDWAGWGCYTEGPSLIQLDASRWRIYLNHSQVYGTPGAPSYYYSDSSDGFATWSAIAPIIQSVGMEHGSFIRTLVLDAQRKAAVGLGLERLTVDSGGSLGVGLPPNTMPLARLHALRSDILPVTRLENDTLDLLADWVAPNGRGVYNRIYNGADKRWVFGRHYSTDDFFIERWTGGSGGANQGMALGIRNDNGWVYLGGTYAARQLELTTPAGGILGNVGPAVRLSLAGAQDTYYGESAMISLGAGAGFRYDFNIKDYYGGTTGGPALTVYKDGNFGVGDVLPPARLSALSSSGTTTQFKNDTLDLLANWSAPSGRGIYTRLWAGADKRWVFGRHYSTDDFFIERWTGGSGGANQGMPLSISSATGVVDLLNGLSINGSLSITSAHVLQNVTADAGIIASGTFDPARIPSLPAGVLTAFCGGAFPGGTTVYMPGYGGGSATVLYCTLTSEISGMPATSAVTAKNLRVNVGSAGCCAGSGIVTLRVNGSNTALTCTTGTGTTCADTSHSISIAAGAVLTISVATGSPETLANMNVAFEVWR